MSKKPVIQFILIAALQRKTEVHRSGEAANFTVIYQFRIGLRHCGMMTDIADWPPTGNEPRDRSRVLHDSSLLDGRSS